MREEKIPVNALELLFSCLRREEDDVKIKQLVSFTAEDWQAITAEAGRHGLSSILYQTIKDLKAEHHIPEHLWGELRRTFYISAARNMRLFNEMKKVFALFKRIGVPVIALKGAHLADQVYSNIALRGMCDLDLLVKEDDLEKIEKIFLEQGVLKDGYNSVEPKYRYHVSYRLPASRLMVEVHWKLFSAPDCCQFDHEAIWQRAEPLVEGQPEVLVLAPEDLLIYVCAHAARHTIHMNSRNLYDIKEILEQNRNALSWPEIEERARLWGVQRSLYVFLRLAHELLGAAITGEQLAMIRPDLFEEKKYSLALSQAYQANAEDLAETSTMAFTFWRYKGLKENLSYFIRLVLPYKEKVARIYSVPANSWLVYFYYPVRLKDLLVRHTRDFFDLLKGRHEINRSAEITREVIDLQKWLLSG